MILENIEEKLSSMRLKGMLSALDSIVGEPKYKKLSFYEKLNFLVEEEYTYKKERALLRKIKRASFRTEGNIEEINYKRKRGLDKDKILELASCKWVKSKSNILITGPTGAGKTYIACALGDKCCREGYKVKYYKASRLINEMSLAKLEGKWDKKLKQLSLYNVLIIDDWGIWELKESSKRDLFEIIDDRTELSSTIISSQIPLCHWHELLGGDNLADAVLDRIVHNAHKLDIDGDSMRKIKYANKS